jgi:hypothetical protein
MIEETLRERASRAAPLCDECRLSIDSPGVMIARGRIVMHVGCDTPVPPTTSARPVFELGNA